jgi:hypothetical protein
MTRIPYYKPALALLALMILILAACAPAAAPMTATATAAATQPPAAATPAVKPTQPASTAAPAEGLSGLKDEDVLIQLTYEPGFTLPEYRYPFGRTPYFTLLADGRVIYIDENQDNLVKQVQLTKEEAAALLQQVRDMGFANLESHTDMCGIQADGAETCIADASTSVMRVRMTDGSLREIRNYANFSKSPATYAAIFNLLNDYSNAKAVVYHPHAATLFIRIVPPPEMSSPTDWPLDPAYVTRAQSAADQFTAVTLNADEAAEWQKNVGINNRSITFQLKGQPVSGFFVPWLPGEDFSKEVAAEFPAGK